MRRVWGSLAFFTWAVTLFAAVLPVSAGEVECGAPVRAAFSEYDRCAHSGAARLQGVLFLMLFAAPPTVRYVAGSRQSPAE